jgi:hypothetical protein
MSRPVGSKNKVGTQVKENIVAVFTRLGGTAEMAEWAKENKTEFYRMYCRLAPTDITVDITESTPERMTDSEIDARISDLEQRLSSGAVESASGAAETDQGSTELTSVH